MTLYRPSRHDPYHSDLIADDKLRKEQEMDVKDLVVSPIVTPVVSPEEALAAWKKYEDLKGRIITSHDIQKIQGKDFLKKSYWRKIATFFNLSLECVTEKRELSPDTEVFFYIVTYKATAPIGRFSYGDGACSSNEKGKMSEHTTRATAHTRAYNRAVSNLVGGGEVSAEEIVPTTGPQTEPPSAPPETTPPETTPLGDISDVMPFGKFKGQSLAQLYKTKRGQQYLSWASLAFKDEGLRQKITDFLESKRTGNLPDGSTEDAPY